MPLRNGWDHRIPLNLRISHRTGSGDIDDVAQLVFINQTGNHRLEIVFTPAITQCSAGFHTKVDDFRIFLAFMIIQRTSRNVALSRRKQSKIMEGIDRVHSHDLPFPTWTVVSQALSAALFAQPDCLRLKSTMNLHQKDYLLFEQASGSGPGNESTTAIISKCIREVDFVSQLDGLTWLCHWKPARPVIANLVQNCKRI